MLSSVMNSASPMVLARALRPSAPVAPESLPDFQDLFLPCDHHPDHPHGSTAQPFDLRERLGRVPTKCYYCNGSGRCQQDYPGPGSGKDWKGEAEYRCSGSGKCQQCAGSGWIYTRYTVTMH